MIKKITSMFLSVLMLFSITSVMFSVKYDAATTNQLNAVARAEYFYNQKWTCQKQVYGWRNQYVFYKGSTYRAPYGQPAIVGKYIGYAVSIDDWLAATKNPSSEYYTKRSHYNYWYSTYYATDCSAFVSWCWGVKRNTTATINNISTNIGAVTVSNAQKLQIGDALNSPSVGHVVLVTGVTKNSSGAVTGIEITEQTPPQLKRTNHTPSTLYSNYSAYTIRRYGGTVPAAPDGSTGEELEISLPVKYQEFFPKCSESATFIEALDALKVDSSLEYRTRIAELNGILGYSGTAEQNSELMELFKAGKLYNPDYVQPKYYPAVNSGNHTLITALESIGVDSSKAYREVIAKENGLATYTGTEAENKYLLDLLSKGKLIAPDGEIVTVPTTESVETTAPQVRYYPACSDTCTTLNEGLADIGVDNSKEYRKEIAAANGITNYTYSAEQNTQMFELLKAGKLIDPSYVPPTTMATEPTQPIATENTDFSVPEQTEPTPPAIYGTKGTIYFTPDESWKESVGRFSAYFYNLSGINYWVNMSDPDGDGTYEAEIPDYEWTNIKFAGFSSASTENLWGETVLKQTVNLTIDGDCFVITGTTTEGLEEKATGFWTKNADEPYFEACDASCVTLNDALTSIGVDNSKANRMRIAMVNGIIDYSYSYEQNASMLELLKKGKLINPDFRGQLPDIPVESVDLGKKFNAFVYGFTSWKLLTPDANCNAILNEKLGDGCQLLKFRKNSDGSYSVFSENDLALTVVNNASVSGANVKFAQYTGARGQKWSISGKDCYYQFSPVCALNCSLEVFSNGTSNGTNMQIGTKSAVNRQYFQILEYEGNYTRTGYENGYVASGDAGSAGKGIKYADGIDVSKWNEKDGDFTSAEFNFKGIKSAGYDYVIIRAGSTNKGKDPMFDLYYDKAKAAGLDVGAYYYTYAMTPAEAEADARRFLDFVKGKKFEYPLYMDFEDTNEGTNQNSLGTVASKNVCMTFLTVVANAGYLSGLYTGNWFITGSDALDIQDVCQTYESWFARYKDSTGATYGPTYSKLYGMFQYWSETAVPNSTWSGAVMDVNYCYKDYPSIVKKYGFNGYSMGGWSDDGKYVYADGSTATGWFEADGETYYFERDGKPVNGWVEHYDSWYLFDSSGKLTESDIINIGDVDGNGSLDIADVTYIQKILARYIKRTENLLKIGDVNSNGRLEIRDVTCIQQYLAKNIDCFKVAEI